MRGVLGLGSLASLFALMPDSPRVRLRSGADKPTRPRGFSHTTTYHNTNGTRECARRLRQIEAGRLTVANGLASEGREVAARKECARRGLDPDAECADGGVSTWMVVDQELVA